MTYENRLAEMLCTRLCHDLTGPIGAVNNGAEFLGDEGFDMQNEAVQLILSSAHEAVNRTAEEPIGSAATANIMSLAQAVGVATAASAR